MVVLFLLAVLGFAASLAVHLATFLDPPPLGMEQTWPLHIGIFLVFIPAVLVQPRSPGPTADAEGPGRAGGRREAFSDAPGWMKAVLGCCFAYALLNFVIFFFTAPSNRFAHGRNVTPLPSDKT